VPKIHVHQYTKALSNAMGFYRKNNLPEGTGFFVKGELQVCAICSGLRLVPYNKHLRPVEVDREEQKN
jgi:hypothetical protein